MPEGGAERQWRRPREMRTIALPHTMSQSLPPMPPPADYPPPVPPTPQRGPGVNIILFLLTCLSTLYVGGAMTGNASGLFYAVGLMAILLTHEMGHYIAARIHHVRASLPYFIPMPFTILGTFGAIIVTRSPFPTRREIFDVGVAGPLAGFVVALPTWLIGLSLSEVVPRETFDAQIGDGLSIEYGESILTWATSHLFFPDMSADAIIIAHPLAIAGWVGLIITAINLLPAGSLDGGHISYAFFWRHHRRLSIATAIGMVLLGSAAIQFWPETPAAWGPIPVSINFEDPRVVWLFWALLVSLFALNHPPPLNPFVPMTRGRKIVAGATLCIFILTFVPAPLRIADGAATRESTDEPELEHDSAPDHERGTGPDSDPGGRHPLDVRAAPGLHLSLRHRPA